MKKIILCLICGLTSLQCFSQEWIHFIKSDQGASFFIFNEKGDPLFYAARKNEYDLFLSFNGLKNALDQEFQGRLSALALNKLNKNKEPGGYFFDVGFFPTPGLNMKKTSSGFATILNGLEFDVDERTPNQRLNSFVNGLEKRKREETTSNGSVYIFGEIFKGKCIEVIEQTCQPTLNINDCSQMVRGWKGILIDTQVKSQVEPSSKEDATP